MIKSSDLCAYALIAVNGGYIYGSSGQKCSYSVRKSCADANPSQRSTIMGKGAKWDGQYVWDCSGLFRGAWRALDKYKSGGATTIWNKWATRKGTIDTMPDKPGIAVFRGDGKTMQHIGLYIGNGEVVDARSTDAGVVHQTLAQYGRWTHWAELEDVEYNGGAPEETVLWRGTVKTKTGGGIGIWTDATKERKVAQIADGTLVDVLGETDAAGFAKARSGMNHGYVDTQYLIPEAAGDEGGEDEDYTPSVVWIAIPVSEEHASAMLDAYPGSYAL